MVNEFKTLEDLKNNEPKLIEWLLSQRLENYGYDFSFFSKMVRKKSYLIRELKLKQHLVFNSFSGIFSRLYLTEKNEIHYIVGQSFNEEYLTILELLVKGGLVLKEVEA